MTKTQTFLCVSCPVGCSLTVEEEGGALVALSGEGCPRGRRYAETELKDPRRTFAGTVAVSGGTLPVCPVRSRGEIPKGLLADVARAVSQAVVEAPIVIGQVIIADVCGSGVDITASRSLGSRP